jgi:general secretion pathway protein B
MSFILDALKKSEAERQRQAGPTLLEVRITQPRRRYPLWAAVVGVLLGVNVVVLAVFLLHRPTTLASERSTESPSAIGAHSAASAAASPALETAGTAASSAAPVAPSAVGLTGSSSGSAKAVDSSTSAGRDSGNPADNEPAVAASGVRVEQPSANNYANLPGIDQLGGNVPALRLDLLDYSDRASERYALINMHRVREGDVLPEGPKVLGITRDGVALDYQGQDFILRPTAP